MRNPPTPNRDPDFIHKALLNAAQAQQSAADAIETQFPGNTDAANLRTNADGILAIASNYPLKFNNPEPQRA